MQPDASVLSQPLATGQSIDAERVVDPSSDGRGPVPRSSAVLRVVDPAERVGDQPAPGPVQADGPTAVSDDALDLVIATLVETSSPRQRSLIISDLIQEIWSTISYFHPVGAASKELDSLARVVVIADAHRDDMHRDDQHR